MAKKIAVIQGVTTCTYGAREEFKIPDNLTHDQIREVLKSRFKSRDRNGKVDWQRDEPQWGEITFEGKIEIYEEGFYFEPGTHTISHLQKIDEFDVESDLLELL